MNVILFGNVVFAHITKAGILDEVAKTPMTGVLIRTERCGDTEKHGTEGGHVMTKAETGVMKL